MEIWKQPSASHLFQPEREASSSRSPVGRVDLQDGFGRLSYTMAEFCPKRLIRLA